MTVPRVPSMLYLEDFDVILYLLIYTPPSLSSMLFYAVSSLRVDRLPSQSPYIENVQNGIFLGKQCTLT